MESGVSGRLFRLEPAKLKQVDAALRRLRELGWNILYDTRASSGRASTLKRLTV